MEAVIDVMSLQARNASSHQKLEEASNGFSPRSSKGSRPCWHLDFGPVILILYFWPPELQKKVFIVLIHPVCGHLLQSHRKLI